MKRILFPTDFSENADHALRFAGRLCKSLNAELILFHACRADALVFQEQKQEIDEEFLLSQEKTRLKYYREKHLPEIPDVPIIEMVEMGFAVDGILEIAREMEVDMIVMGTQGASGLEGILLGSNTAEVMEKATCPVIAVPAGTDDREIKKVAFATDFREKDSDAIRFLSGIAGLFEADLYIVHIEDPMVPDAYENAMEKVFEREILEKVRYKNIIFENIRGTNSTRTLNDYVKDHKIDLIAVSTRKKNLFTRIFDKSFTKQLAYHSTIPVMAFHQPA